MMEGYFPLKMKRKDLEDVNEDFSDFSLSSPARKIRRLDAELPPIIEEAEYEIPLQVEQPPPPERLFGRNSSGGSRIKELPSVPENEERAIVLFKPIHSTPFLHSPSNFSVCFDPDLVSGFKNQVLWSQGSTSLRLDIDEADRDGENSVSNDRCLAVVPWVPSQLPSGIDTEICDTCEMMDAEEVDGTTMDIENGTDIQQTTFPGGINLSEGLHQWQMQQQHCMSPQVPPNTAMPIFWHR